MKRIIALDTECFYDKKKKVSVVTQGAWLYTHDPAFYCYLLTIHDGEETWVGEPKDFNWYALEGNHLLSHNAFFDRNVYEAGVEKGLYPRIEFAEWDCTANMTAALCNRRSLADAAWFLLGEEMDKGPRDEMDGMHWHQVKGTPLGERLLTYAGGDAQTCWRLFEKYGPYWSEFERRLSRLTIKQCMHGVQIDVPKLEIYLDQAKRLLFKIERRIPWVESGEKPSGTKAMNLACRAAGIPTPPIKKHEGEEAHAQWLKKYCAEYPWVSAVTQWRSLNKFVGALEKIQERLRPDGTLSFGLKYAGAHTLRWSGDAGVNLQTLRKVPLLVDKNEMLRVDEKSEAEYLETSEEATVPEWLSLTNWGLKNEDGSPLDPIFEYAFDIRSLIIARPGKKLIVCDESQIEPRVLAVLAGHERLIEQIRNGYGVYEAAAVATGKYNGPKGGFKKKKSLYKAQKAQVLALGYGCGPDRYEEAAMEMAQYDVAKNDRISEKTGLPIKGSAARKEVKEWREENPEIPEYWNKLEQEFKACEGGDYRMELPSGRIMTYRDIRCVRKLKTYNVLDEDTGLVIETRILPRWVYSAEIDKKRYEMWGGDLAENKTQATARDIFGFHLLLLDEAGYDVLWSVHDESITEVDLEVDPKLIEAIHSTSPPWFSDCPLGAEARETPCYVK